MGFLTNDLILRTVTDNDIKEIARMWEYLQETTIDKAYEASNVIIGWCGLDDEAEIGKQFFLHD